jgi:hypothetical protein
VWRDPVRIPGLDRVLERRAVDLDRVGHPGARERAGEDHRAHDEVIGERHVRGSSLGDLADGGHVRGEVGIELGGGELGERARLDPLVAVRDVDGEQAADVRPVDRRPCRGAPLLHLQGA